MTKQEYKLTTEDKERMGRDMNNNPIMRFLQNRDENIFNVGDILVKQSNAFDYKSNKLSDKWETETVSFTNNAPKKYMYVFENELNVGYVRPINVNGKLSEKILMCIADINHGHERFTLDPEYVDHIVLSDNEEFDPQIEYRNRKADSQALKNKNKKLLIKDLVGWFNSVKPGDKFWLSSTLTDIGGCEFEVIDTPYKDCGEWERNIIREQYGKIFERGQNAMDNHVRSIAYKVVNNPYLTKGKTFQEHIRHLAYYHITTQQPFLEDPLAAK